MATAELGEGDAVTATHRFTGDAPGTTAPQRHHPSAPASARADCAAGNTHRRRRAHHRHRRAGVPAVRHQRRRTYIFPEDGQGFESAVAMAVAESELGVRRRRRHLGAHRVRRRDRPGPKDFDFNLQQYTITDERASVVDFSEGYYTARPRPCSASPTRGAATPPHLADLKGLKIGVARAGTTSAHLRRGGPSQPDRRSRAHLQRQRGRQDGRSRAARSTPS